MSIFPDRQLGQETFNNLLNEADFILTIDLDFVNKSLQRFLEKKFRELPKVKKDELINKYHEHDILSYIRFVDNLNIEERIPFFWDALFKKLGFKVNSKLFIEFIPDYDCKRYWNDIRKSTEEYYPPQFEDLFSDPVPDYYFIDLPHLSKIKYTNDGTPIHAFEKMERIEYYCFDNGTINGYDEPWFCCNLDHLKINLNNNAYLISNKNLVDFTVLFPNTSKEFHPEGEFIDFDDFTWLDFQKQLFKDSKTENDEVKKELKKLFKKKQLSTLEIIFNQMFYPS